MTVEPELGEVVTDQDGFSETVLTVITVGAHAQDIFVATFALPTQLDPVSTGQVEGLGVSDPVLALQEIEKQTLWVECVDRHRMHQGIHTAVLFADPRHDLEGVTAFQLIGDRMPSAIGLYGLLSTLVGIAAEPSIGGDHPGYIQFTPWLPGIDPQSPIGIEYQNLSFLALCSGFDEQQPIHCLVVTD